MFIATRLYVYTGHNGMVFDVAWSPDGNRIASGGADGTLQVWVSMSMGRPITYNHHPNSVTAVAWSPDGVCVASGGSDGMVQVWDTTTDQRVLTYRGHIDTVAAVAWSPDGTRIASGGHLADKTIQVWRAKTGDQLIGY